MRAPSHPAIFQPISVASIRPGPGAVREIANISMNSRGVIQVCNSTACRWIAGSTLTPPPNERNESGMKAMARARLVLSDIATQPVSGERDADGGYGKRNGNERQPQDADQRHRD